MHKILILCRKSDWEQNFQFTIYSLWFHCKAQAWAGGRIHAPGFSWQFLSSTLERAATVLFLMSSFKCVPSSHSVCKSPSWYKRMVERRTKGKGRGRESRKMREAAIFSVSAKTSLPISLSLSPFPFSFPSSSGFPSLFLSLSFSLRPFVCAKTRIFAFIRLGTYHTGSRQLDKLKVLLFTLYFDHDQVLVGFVSCSSWTFGGFLRHHYRARNWTFDENHFLASSLSSFPNETSGENYIKKFMIKRKVGVICYQSCLIALVFCTKLYRKLAVSLCSFLQFSFPFNFWTANALVLKFCTLPLSYLFSNTLLAILISFFVQDLFTVLYQNMGQIWHAGVFFNIARNDCTSTGNGTS